MDHAEIELETEDIFKCDGWKAETVTINVPTCRKDPNGNRQPFSIEGFRYRPLTAVIQATFSEATFKWFHLTPFKCVWKSLVSGKLQRLYGELYLSDVWNNEHDKVQKQQRTDGCELERVIAGLMF